MSAATRQEATSRQRSRGCNTRSNDRNCRPSSSGLDTVSYAFRPRGERDLDAFDRFLSRARNAVADRETGEVLRLRRTAQGGVLVASPINGARVGFFPGPGLIFCEGRLAALMARSEDDHALAPSGALVPGSDRAREALGRVGLELVGTPAIRRLDLAGELRFKSGADGLSFMRTLASLDVPGLKRDVWMRGTRVETVYYRTLQAGAVRLRAYDKGVEAKTDAPGVRIRLERQVRYAKRQQQTPATVAGSDLAKLYKGRLAAWTNATGDIVATNLTGAQNAVLSRLSNGAITERRAERLLGTLVLLERFGDGWWDKPHTRQRRVRELRDLGVALDLERLEAEPVPVGELIKRLSASFATD